MIVVNDASPEPAIVDFVRDLAARGKATLIEQPVAQGCAAALNRAFALHRDRDKVVLHADAEATGDWLDRLAAHAGAPEVGVVGTFTNAVGTATYPSLHRNSVLPDGYTTATLDALFVHANRGESIALPVIHASDRATWSSYAACLNLPEPDRATQERELFKLDHAAFGALLAKRLSLPELYCAATGAHQQDGQIQ